MLARKFNVSHHTIRRWLRKQNITIRTVSEAGKLASLEGRLFRQHKIPISSKKFTKEKAYMLGVMCGDGYIHKAKHSYQIGLQATDKDFVIKFSKCIERIYQIKPSFSIRLSRHRNWNDQWQTRLVSKSVYNDIINYGAWKADTWSVPSNLLSSPRSLKTEFLQGFFDSEGHVDVKYKRVSAISINIDGLNGIKNLLDSLQIRSTIRSVKIIRGKRRKSYNINIEDRKSIELFHKFIGFGIKRKSNQLDSLVKSYKLWKSTKEEIARILPSIKELRGQNLSYQKIGRKLNVSPSTVFRNKKVDATKDME
jgi:intein-encoded DNA endonuclease-like protein